MRRLPWPNGHENPVTTALDLQSRSMHDIAMKQKTVYESGLVRPSKLEQAMAWLVDNGPLLEEPELPSWILHELVKAGRIARPRRGLYLAPSRSGEMLSLPTIATHLEPQGYLSFYGALVLHNLTDQETATWQYVSPRRLRPLRLGQTRLEFVPWPSRLRSAEAKVQTVGGLRVRIASPEQALCDVLEAPRLAPSWSELVHVVHTGLALRRVGVTRLRLRAQAIDSPALARRLGLLLEMETGSVDRTLLKIAQRSNDWTRLAGLGTRVRARDARWRLELPRSRAELLAAVRE